MRWPFHRQQPDAREPSSPPPPPPPAPSPAAARRDWAALPPLAVARPIALTAQTSAFTEQLASRQEMARTARPVHLRKLNEPTATLHGALVPSVAGGPVDAALVAPGREIEHRRPSAPAAEPAGMVESFGTDAVAHLLAIDGPVLAPDVVEGPPPLPRAEPSPPIEPSGKQSHPGRPSLASSRRLGLGPAYHGALPEAMQAERERVEPVPPDLRAAMHDVLGVDVGDRPVRRGPAVSEEAAAMGAKAFARDGDVHVSDEVGPLDTSSARSIVAHELTHVAQQRRLPNAPVEDSAEGQRMEAQAREVERFVRGDATAPRPQAPPEHEQTVADARDLMRELVDEGLARPDGDGGIVFTMPPAPMTHAGAQRLTEPAGPDRSSAAHSSNWNAGDTFLHGLGNSLANDMLNISGSFLGFSDDFMKEQRDELSEENLQFGQQQTKEAYREMRMEHLRGRRLTTLHAQQDAAHQARADHLSDVELRQIEQRVDEEVRRRTAALTEVANEALAAVNAERTRQGQGAHERLAPASYDTAFHLMFDHPDADEQPGHDALLNALQAEIGSARRPGATAPVHPATDAAHPAATPGATTAAAPAAPTGAGATPSTSTPPATSPATAATPSTAHPTPTPTPAPTGAGHDAAHPTPTHPAAEHGAPHGEGQDQHRGLHWAENEDGERQWVAERDQTVGQNFSSLGRHLVGDVFHEQLGGLASAFGFDDHFTREIEHDADRDLGILQPSRADGAGTAGAHPGAHDDHHAATGAASHAATGQTAHDTVSSISRDPYALDELALRLYPSIRTRLRQELLIDRERAGLLTDFR